MGSADSFYVTTPIYYVNGTPHIGHAYTTTAADVLARWMRLKGVPTLLLTGIDEHGQKVLEAARARGVDPQAHCDEMADKWRAMMSKLDIQYDRFMRTTDADHETLVCEVLSHLYERGEIYRDDYTGWYSVSEETFVTEKEIAEGKYDKADLQAIKESNYFFKMSAYQERLLAHIEANPDFLRPELRRNEVLGFLRKPLGDLCISRPKARMSWGIPLPFDPDYVTYVWFDALLNYLTATGYRVGKMPDETRFWPADYQLLGKDILTTHAVYWSTMLLALDVPLPTTLFAHGWWVAADGQKMSKSKGNALDIDLLIEGFGLDAVRYYFLRELAFGQDGRFSWDGFLNRYNADLANDLGNLAHRGLSMTEKWLGGTVPASAPGPDEAVLVAQARALVRDFDAFIERAEFHKALDLLWDLVRAGNKYVDTQAPWALNKAGDTARLATVLRTVLELCHLAAALLLPVLPAKSPELLARLGRDKATAVDFVRAALAGADPLDGLAPGDPISLGEPLFPRLLELPESITRELIDAPVPAPQPAPSPKRAPKPVAPPVEAADEIAFEDFAKVALRVGRVLTADKHPNADKLLVITVDVGEPAPRTICAGIANKFAPEDLVGRNVVVVVNLAPRKMRGIVSQGMILAAGATDVIDLVGVNAEPGEVVR